MNKLGCQNTFFIFVRSLVTLIILPKFNLFVTLALFESTGFFLLNFIVKNLAHLCLSWHTERIIFHRRDNLFARDGEGFQDILCRTNTSVFTGGGKGFCEKSREDVRNS